MACKGCGGKSRGNAEQEPAPTNTGSQPGGWVAKWAEARKQVLDLLSDTEWAAHLSDKSSGSDLIDALCAALVACREAEKALQLAMAEGADCSAIEEELKQCEQDNEDLQKQLDMYAQMHEGDHTEVTADGIPHQASVPTKPIQTFRQDPPQGQSVRKEEIRPGYPGGHVRNVHPVNHPGVRPR